MATPSPTNTTTPGMGNPNPGMGNPNPGTTQSPMTQPTQSPMTQPTQSPVMPPAAKLDGAQLYKDHGCLACHGNDGQQKSAPIVFANYTYDSLLAKIENTMPPQNPGACVGACAEAVAEYTWSLRPQQTACGTTEASLPRRVRLLTKFEYVNTINDLFSRSDADSLANLIGSDTEVKGFDSNVRVNKVTSVRLDAYWNTAQRIAASVNFNKWLNTNNCSRNEKSYCFVEKFGRDAFRRELSDEEKTDYQAVFNEGADDAAAAKAVAQAMLISPNFLYRNELGQNGQLTQYEIASLLSYTFWGSMPDSALLDKAKNNQLNDASKLEKEVQRLLASDKARKQFVHFGRQWLDVDAVESINRDKKTYPDFSKKVASAMDKEIDMFLTELMLSDGYTMKDFFQNDFTFVNQDLASFYGMAGVSGQAMQKVNSDATRGGVLGLGAVLVNNAKFDDTNPIKRGLLVRRHLLCQEFGTPPPAVGEVEPFDASKPTRERFAAHTKNENCASCHQYIDEIGFAFENFDAVGKYRSTEGNNLPIDASGSISGLELMTGSDRHAFTNLQDLAGILASNGLTSASECLVENFQRMMEGVEKPDPCKTTNTATRWGSGSIKDLWVEMIASQSFTKRQ